VATNKQIYTDMPSKLLPWFAAVLLCAAATAVHATSRSPGHKLTVHRQQHNPNAAKTNNRPVIGVLTQAGLDEDTFVPANGSYIAASYVKFVEGGGARVVPILHDSPPEVVSRVAAATTAAAAATSCSHRSQQPNQPPSSHGRSTIR
jgi:hypothetical protein